jgi:hypothetical protein
VVVFLAYGSRRSYYQHSGGDPHASAQSARVILADPNTEVFQHLVKVYQGIPDKYIESYLWVKKCVEKGTLVYTPLVYKNPGGRRPGEEYALPITSFLNYSEGLYLRQAHAIHRGRRATFVQLDRRKDSL